MSSYDDDLAARAERGELHVKPGGINLRGDAAANEARRLLMEATGATTPEEVVQIAVGRPPAGTKRGPSPVIRVRVPQSLKDRVAALAEREQRKEPDIVRDALAAYLEVRAG